MRKMKKILLIVLPVVILLCAAGGAAFHLIRLSPTPPAPNDASPYTYNQLIWSDEFSGSKLDETKWRCMYGTGPEEGYPAYWGNNEMQKYREKNAVVQDGHLAIRVIKEDAEDMHYTSARLTTSGLFSFTYGRVEARMKLPVEAEGLWPAFWMLPNGQPADWPYGTWAASGEIDIMENRSRVPGEVSGAAHHGGAWPENIVDFKAYKFPKGESGVQDWHIYTLEWSPDRLVWYVDGNAYFTLEDWFSGTGSQAQGPPQPFDSPFCLIMNCAVGGNYDENRAPDAGFADAEMLVDWVRVYQ